MSSLEVNRMKQDLAVIHQALRFEPVFGWGDVWFSLTQLGVGLGLAASGGLKMSVPGFPYAGRLIAAFIIILLFSIIALRLRRQKAKHPARWREARVGLISAAVIFPLLCLFLKWSLHQGLSFQSVSSAVVFVGGLAVLVIAICDRNRLHYLGVAIPMMILGPAFPAIVLNQHQINQHRIDLFIGLFFASIGGLSAGIMAWQLRRQGNG